MFIAINFITCIESYKTRFEMLFSTRAHAIDGVAGFEKMHVLKQNNGEGPYLVVSYWENEDSFKGWMNSPAFREGHKRAFEDMDKSKEEWDLPPMVSEFRTYQVIAR